MFGTLFPVSSRKCTQNDTFVVEPKTSIGIVRAHEITRGAGTYKSTLSGIGVFVDVSELLKFTRLPFQIIGLIRQLICLPEQSCHLLLHLILKYRCVHQIRNR